MSAGQVFLLCVSLCGSLLDLGRGWWAASGPWGPGSAVDLDSGRACGSVGAVASSVLPLGADGADLATSLLDSLPWDMEELPPQI